MRPAALRTHLVRSLGLREETKVAQPAADMWPQGRRLADSAMVGTHPARRWVGVLENASTRGTVIE